MSSPTNPNGVPIHFDQSTFLAARAQQAKALGPPKPPTHVALPGALAAVPHDRLLAYQEHGLGEHEIRARVNAAWSERNAGRVHRHRGWVSAYDAAIAEARERAMREAAEAQRKRAEFERFIAERLAEGE